MISPCALCLDDLSADAIMQRTTASSAVTKLAPMDTKELKRIRQQMGLEAKQETRVHRQTEAVDRGNRDPRLSPKQRPRVAYRSFAKPKQGKSTWKQKTGMPNRDLSPETPKSAPSSLILSKMEDSKQPDTNEGGKWNASSSS